MKDLVRNPIGIIALFISLIYGFANLLLGMTAKALTPDERYPIVIFIVLFPVVVLAIFYLLVSRHHGKLYAPGDYKDDTSFLRTLSTEERELRLEAEAEEVIPTIAAPALQVAQPEMPGEPSRSIADIRSEIRAVENAVISRLESEFKQTAVREVGVGETDANFDAFFLADGKPTFVEVKIQRFANQSALTLDRVLYNAVIADKFMNGNFKLLLVVVHSFDSADVNKVEAVWRQRVGRCPADVELRFVPRSDLAV